MGKKLLVLQKELSESKEREKHLKTRIHLWMDKAREERRMLKVLILQYEMVNTHLRKTIKYYRENSIKLFLLFLYKKYENWKEGRRVK